MPNPTVPTGLLCSCGNLARYAHTTERFGLVGDCGVPGRRPLDPCDCTAVASSHDRAWCAQRNTAKAGR